MFGILLTILKVFFTLGGVILLLALFLYVRSPKETPEHVTYGMSFNTLYAEELGLDWQETYDAILSELGVRHLRLAAHWPMVESKRGEYNFSELDYQVQKAHENNATVIMAVGRRLPRWPECHIPDWAADLTWSEQKDELRDYIKTVVERYKDEPAIIYWQVENEPYLEVFAKEHCGVLDKDFFKEEIALVRSLDGTRPILVTDSGNIGTWFGAYKNGDVFGTSMYVFFWNPELGQFKSVLPPWYYRLKEGLMKVIYGTKPTVLIELSAEPWLIAPITDTPLDVQYSRMNLDKFNEILDYAGKTQFDKQYLWGAEWWYWLRLQDRPEMWERGKELFQ